MCCHLQVHFFRPVPKEYLHSAELRDIMQFGSSNTAVFFKMRVAGVLHIFQFETKQVITESANSHGYLLVSTESLRTQFQHAILYFAELGSEYLKLFWSKPACSVC